MSSEEIKTVDDRREGCKSVEQLVTALVRDFPETLNKLQGVMDVMTSDSPPSRQEVCQVLHELYSLQVSYGAVVDWAMNDLGILAGVREVVPVMNDQDIASAEKGDN